MTLVRKALPRVTPDLEVTVEGVAQLFTRPKLEAMRDAGVTRVSMGVQQFDRELLKLSGRKQDLDHVLRMIELSQTLGLGCNVDLIFGWPGQSVEQMCRDLDMAVRLKVPHITHYELNVAGRTDFARRRDQLPSVTQNLEMYRISKGLLEANGYRQVTPYDWERIDAGAAGVLRYEALARTPFERATDGGISGYDVWGWGFAGLSRWFGDPGTPGWTVMNCPRVEQYYKRLDDGQVPVERGFRYAEPDLRIYTLFQMLQGISVDRSLYRRLFGVDPLDEHWPIWQALVERKWILAGDERLEIVGDGGFHVPMIQGLLATHRLGEMRRARKGQGDGSKDTTEVSVLEGRS
jgi:oxygen-independent coproporphyrinogen-3 oxidase